VYSLVSAPVLGFDLSRSCGGARAAQVLERALALEPGDLPALADQHSDDTARLTAWVELGRSGECDPELGPLVAGITAAVGAGEPVRRTTLSLLEAARIGNLGALLRCVRHDVFDWTWTGSGDVRVQSEAAAAAVAVVCDAVAAAYAQDRLTAASRRRLSVGWLRASRALPDAAVDLGPQAEAIGALLGRVRRIDAADRARLDVAMDTARRHAGESGLDWTTAVHEASWAVHLSDRVRSAGAAQLLLVDAVAGAGIPVDELAAGTWNLLSGAVHALVVRDIAGASVLHPLLSPYLWALGVAA
jgi:hypothetical protein